MLSATYDDRYMVSLYIILLMKVCGITLNLTCRTSRSTNVGCTLLQYHVIQSMKIRSIRILKDVFSF